MLIRAVSLVLIISLGLAVSTEVRDPVIICTDIPEDNGGRWECDPPHHPGHAYHVGTECMFYCEGEAQGLIWCNELGRWKPEKPEEFSCGVTTTTATSTSTASTTTTKVSSTTMTEETTTSTATTSGTSSTASTTSTTTTSPNPGPDSCDTQHWLPEGSAPEDNPQCVAYDGSLVPDCAPYLENDITSFYHIHEYNCSRFWECSPQGPCLFECAACPADSDLCSGQSSLSFDCRYEWWDGPVCDWPANVDCTYSTPNPYTTSTTATTASTSTTTTTTTTTTSTTTTTTSTTITTTTSFSTTTSTTTTTATSSTTSTTTRTTSTTTTTTMSTTTSADFPDCPFNKMMNEKNIERSIYCPKDVCTAVFIESEGLASVHHPDSLGCFNYEGSLFDNTYPDYINRQGLFLTPDAYSNPGHGIIRWIVSDNVMSETGTIRNFNHDDINCPYDLHDGWEYLDPVTGEWIEDDTIQIICVKP